MDRRCGNRQAQGGIYRNGETIERKIRRRLPLGKMPCCGRIRMDWKQFVFRGFVQFGSRASQHCLRWMSSQVRWRYSHEEFEIEVNRIESSHIPV